MRIISGEFRSRKLRFPKSKKTRPMTDRAKETIFNILGETVRDARVLDLFAGSGSLGLEALSRGARHATFVEEGAWAEKSLSDNVKTLGLTRQSTFLRQDVFKALRRFGNKGENFELIFLDPPYNQGVVKKLLNDLSRSAILTAQTRIVLHRSRQEKLPDSLEGLALIREKQIGQACLSFLSKSVKA